MSTKNDWISIKLKGIIACVLIVYQCYGIEVVPSGIDNLYLGDIRVKIDNINTGAVVVIKRFLDLNKNGIVDPGEPLTGFYSIKDGQPQMIDGVINRSIPYDTTGVDGKIECLLNYWGTSLEHVVGHYIFVAQLPSGNVQTATLIVTNAPTRQKLIGKVTCGGRAVPYAIVLVLDEEYGSIQTGVVADENGNYDVNLEPGRYFLMIIAPGYLMQIEPDSRRRNIVLEEGTTLEYNVELLQATTYISGKIIDSQTKEGLPGVVGAGFSEDRLFSAAVADEDGNFKVWAKPGRWRLEADSYSLASLGYVCPSEELIIEVGSMPVENIIAPVPKGSSLIWGKITDQEGNPVPGISIYIEQADEEYYVDAISDSGGWYAVAVTPDKWRINLDYATSSKKYVFPRGFEKDVPNEKAVRVDWIIKKATTSIDVVVQTSTGILIPGVEVWAFNINGSFQSEAKTDDSGWCTIPVFEGDWIVGVACEDLEDYGFICPESKQVMVGINGASVEFIITGGNIQPPPPQIYGLEYGTGYVAFKFVAYPGYDYYLERSSDLKSWSVYKTYKIDGNHPSEIRANISLEGLPSPQFFRVVVLSQ